MSKFWGGGDSSDEEPAQEEISEDEKPVARQVNEKRFATAFIDDSDSDSDNERRVVKSQKERAFEAIHDLINRIKNARRNEDWSLVQDLFNNVNKQIEKSKLTIMQYGMPPVYIKMLAELEDHVLTTSKDKELVKKMKAVVSKALNQMKLQVRKHNDNYRTEIEDFRAHPEKYEEKTDDSDEDGKEDGDSESAESSSDEESVEVKKAPAPKRVAVTKEAGDSSDEDSLFEGDGGADESDSDDEDDGRQELTGRARWLKKVPVAADGRKKERTEREQRRDRAVEANRDGNKTRGTVSGKEAAPTAAAWSVVDTMTVDELDRRVVEIVMTRGRRNGAEAKDALRLMEVLSKFSRRHGPHKEIPVVMHLISMRLDSLRSIDDYLEHGQWSSCARNIGRVLQLAEQHSLQLVPLGSEDPAELSLAYMKPDEAASSSEEQKSGSGSNNKSVVRVVGSVESFIARLEDEYTKALQQINPHTAEYVVRLADEALLVELEQRALRFYRDSAAADSRAAAQLALLLVEHLYYKHVSQAVAVDQAHAFNKQWGRHKELHPASKGRGPQSAPPSSTERNAEVRHPASFLGPPSTRTEPVDHTVLLQELCSFLFEQADERQKTRALLCLVFHHALHDRYQTALDLFLMARVQDFAEKAEVRTQILYNRTVIALGLCAFRLGLFAKAHDLLAPICSGRWKELLAQGAVRSVDKDPATEREERRRQMPYHMHMNPELLEACHLTAAMLLELPVLARSLTGAVPQQGISRLLRKYLAGYRRQAFTGPPETVREHILAATEALLSSRWKEASACLIDGLETWQFTPGGGAPRLRHLLQQRLQEEAIRCHLLQTQAADCYESLSLANLADTFDVDIAFVRRIICKMIFHRELIGSLQLEVGGPGVLLLHRTEATPLQTAAVTAADRLAALQESSERVLDSCAAGLYGFKDDWKSDVNKRAANDGYGQRSGAGGRGSAGGGRGGGGAGYRVLARGNRREGGGGRGGARNYQYQQQGGSGVSGTGATGNGNAAGGGGSGYKPSSTTASAPKNAWTNR